MFVVNPVQYKSARTHWIAFYVNGNIMTYFDSFGVEHISKESKKLKRNKNIKIYRIQAHDSVMCGYFYIDLLILCLKVKT